jgi:hypothetical protein
VSNTNDIIEDENEEKKTSLQIENDIKDKNLKFINVKEKSKIEKLKKIIENITPLKFYFNRLKKAIYIKNRNKERENILKLFVKIYYRNIIKKYFEILRTNNIEIKEDIENICLAKNDEDKNLEEKDKINYIIESNNKPENKDNLEIIKNKDENYEKLNMNVLKSEKDTEIKKNANENENDIIIDEILNIPIVQNEIQNKSDNNYIKEISKIDKTDNLENRIIPKDESKGQEIENKNNSINITLNENIENNNLNNIEEGTDKIIENDNNEDKKDIKDLNEDMNDIKISEIF